MVRPINKLEILLKKARQRNYELKNKLNRIKDVLAAAEITIQKQAAALEKALVANTALKKQQARLKRQLAKAEVEGVKSD